MTTVIDGDFEWDSVKATSKRKIELETELVRVLGRGLRAQKGVPLTLRTLREATGKSQVDVTGASQIDQGDISRLEGRETFDDCQVSTLQRYIAALGGRLELVATFGDKKIVVTGVLSVKTAGTSADKALPRTGRKPVRR
jgi:hypothetical protein